MLSVISLLVAVLLLSGSSEQSSQPGSCSDFDVPAKQPFYPATIAGKVWYLIATDDTGLPYHDFDCIRFFHTVAPGTGLKTTESATNLATSKFGTSKSFMKFTGSNGSYTYKTANVADQPTKIVSTDLWTYYVEISCVDVDGEAQIYVGIFSTLPVLSSATLSEIYTFLEGYQINTSNLRFVEQRPIKCGY